MKSFIKSHRRSESVQSDTSSTTMKSPLSSPGSNYTARMQGSVSNSSSPKKLLVPIKNLFNKKRPSADLTDIFMAPPPDNNNKQPYVRVSNVGHGSVKVLHASKSMSSRKSSRRKPQSQLEDDNEETDYSSDNSNDSNFSFVKDMKGGRNTSIKYYKTKPIVKQKQLEDDVEAYFENDPDIDVEDYDYDNNGLDDLDELEDDINYIDDFDDPITSGEKAVIGGYNDVNVESVDNLESDSLGYEDDFHFGSGDQGPKTPTVGAGYDNDNDNDFNDYDDYDYDDEDASIRDYDYEEDAGELEERFNEITVDDGADVDVHENNEPVEAEENDSIYNFTGFQNDTDAPFVLGSMKETARKSRNKAPFNHSYHLSMEGFKTSLDDKSSDALDVLDSYLDMDGYEGSVTSTPQFRSIDDLQLYDLESPLINGITVGDSLTTRFNHISPGVYSVKQNSQVKSLHLSIDEISLFKDPGEPDIGLGILSSVQNPTTDLLVGSKETKDSLSPTDMSVFEGNGVDNSSLSLGKDNKRALNSSFSAAQLEIDNTLRNLETNGESVSTTESLVDNSASNSSVDKKINRQSINEMMNMLENLQTNDEASQKSKRNSIENMMSFLKSIQKIPNNDVIPAVNPKPTNPVVKPVFPRQHKIQEEEEPEVDEPPNFIDSDMDLSELEKDLIDEVNQLPEDFDFKANDDIMNQFESLNKSFQSSAFMRSKSFNKKPKKMLPSGLRNCNKLETSNKTVTFYGNRSFSGSRQKSHSPIDDLSTITEKN